MRRFLKAFIASALLSITVTAVSQEPKVPAPHRPFSPKVKKPYPLPPGEPGSMVGGPWIVDANFKSAVYIKNGVETSTVTVTPVLYLSNGKSYQLADIPLEPSGTSVLDIGASLQKLGIAPYATLSGYIELKYNWPWDPICATIRNLDTTHSLIFTYGLRSSKAPNLPNMTDSPTSRTSRVVEGLWWKQEANVTGFVALANTTSQVMNVNVELSDDIGAGFIQKTARVSPHGSKMLDLFELASARTSVGGIRITYNGTATDLLINGGLHDVGSGYSANLPFTTAPASKSNATATVAELGLMTGPADPMMRFPSGTTFTPYTVLRNVSGSAIKATPTLWWMASESAHSVPLAPITLAPYQSQVLDFPGMLAQAGLKNFSGNVQLAFKVEGYVGGLLVAGGSVDKANTYVFEVAPHGIAESASKSLSYWNIADGDDTMVTIWNPADEAQDFIFQLSYSGGHYGYPVHLEGRNTRTFNISEIIESGIPDAEGNIIPDGTLTGGAQLMGKNADNEHILVAMDAGTYNVRKATCGTYCQTCNGVTTWSVVDNPFSVAMGGQHQLAFHETWNTGSYYDDTSSGNWTTSASSIAGVGTRGNGTPGMVGGSSPGQASISAQYIYSEPEYTSYWCEGSQWSCPLGYVSGSGQSPGTVVAVPTNFHYVSAQDAGDGILKVNYAWNSSTGNLADLSSCYVSELVTYPGTANPYQPPSPPFPIASSPNPIFGNPTVTGTSGSSGGLQDQHGIGSPFVKPYSHVCFSATQTYRYNCTGLSGYTNLMSNISITRCVNQSTSTIWDYLITKTGVPVTATILPLP